MMSLDEWRIVLEGLVMLKDFAGQPETIRAQRRTRRRIDAFFIGDGHVAHAREN